MILSAITFQHPGLIIFFICVFFAMVFVARYQRRRKKLQRMERRTERKWNRAQRKAEKLARRAEARAGSPDNSDKKPWIDPWGGNENNISATPLSDPYVILFNNLSDEKQTARLFGWNGAWNRPNFGNPTQVKVTNIQVGEEEGFGYAFLLAQTADNPFKVGKMRFHSSEEYYKNYVPSEHDKPGEIDPYYGFWKKKITVYHADGNGKRYSSPFLLKQFASEDQLQKFIVDADKAVTVDGKTHFDIELEPHEILVVSVYPQETFSPKAALNGGELFRISQPPQLSGKPIECKQENDGHTDTQH